MLVQFWPKAKSIPNHAPDSSLLAFFIAVTGLTLIPGATTMLVIRRAMLGGPRASLMTIAGGSLGVFVHAIVAALGLSILFQQSEPLRVAVRWAGAAYLIWLGAKSLWRAWQGEALLTHLTPLSQMGEGPGVRAAFAEGLVTILLSPETALFYFSALSQFISPNEWVLGQALVLASIHAGVRIGWYSLIAAFVGRIAKLLVQPLVQRSLEGATGALLILFALRTATSKR